jgi:sialidase-1
MQTRVHSTFHRFLIAALLAVITAPAILKADGLKKISDIVIYKDEKFHSAFPSIIRRPNGDLMVAFRRAPDRRLLGEKSYSHTDPNSYLYSVRSKDDGKTWTEPQLMFAHPFGGSQDPCLLQLRDGTILCESYAWFLVPKATADGMKKPQLAHYSSMGTYVFEGGYFIRSEDGGKTWLGPTYAPPVPVSIDHDIYGARVPAFNRGAMCQGKDGRIYWVAAANVAEKPRRTQTHLMISADQGRTWQYSCPVAQDPNVTFNETSLYETPKGDLVAFMRTADFDDHTVIARSTDHGKSFQKWQDAGFQGHPHYALRLPDERVLLIYGYRHKPIGIRARVLNPECTDFATAKEIVLRDDGGSVDIGYPWATMIGRKKVLVVYYFNISDGPRHIAGTTLELD